MLIAANLNQQTLRGGVPTAFAGLLTKQQRDEFLAYAVEPPGRPADWMRVIDHQYGSIDFARWDDPGGPLEPSDPVRWPSPRSASSSPSRPAALRSPASARGRSSAI